MPERQQRPSATGHSAARTRSRRHGGFVAPKKEAAENTVSESGKAVESKIQESNHETSHDSMHIQELEHLLEEKEARIIELEKHLEESKASEAANGAGRRFIFMGLTAYDVFKPLVENESVVAHETPIFSCYKAKHITGNLKTDSFASKDGTDMTSPAAGKIFFYLSALNQMTIQRGAMAGTYYGVLKVSSGLRILFTKANHCYEIRQVPVAILGRQEDSAVDIAQWLLQLGLPSLEDRFWVEGARPWPEE